MLKTSKLLAGFLKSELTKGTGLRILGVIVLSLMTTTSIIYINYYNYWAGTIYRTQTVDFNILSNLLPTKLSIYLSKKQLSQNDLEGLQRTLDSNYGLFGIVVTDCTVSTPNCPGQNLLYATKAIVKKTPEGKNYLLPKNNQIKIWNGNFENKVFSEEYVNKLPFVILRNPPPLNQEWEYKTPYNDKVSYTAKYNSGEIIGRAYLLRTNQPSFSSELQKWIKDIYKNFNNSSAHISSRSLVYNSIMISSFITGFLVLIAIEFAYYSARQAQKKQDKAEQKLIIAYRNNENANQEKEQAQKAANAAQIASEQAIAEKEAAERAASVISEQAILEKIKVEKAVIDATKKSERAIRDKQKAEYDLNFAIQKKQQAEQEAKELYDFIGEDTQDLENQISQLQIDKKSLENKLKETNKKIGNEKEIVHLLLHNIDFLRDSLDIIFSDLNYPLKVLEQIQMTSYGQRKSKRLEVTSGKWSEQHIDNNYGWRLYIKPEQERFKVYISHKKNQEKDFEYLKKQ